MEDYPLDKLTALEGELSDLHTPGSKGIAAVYQTDDYGNVIKSSNWAKLGDTVKLEYVDEFDYVSPETGEPVDPASGENYVLKVVKSHTVEYTVTALVSVPTSLSYRYYGSDEFVLNAQTFIADTGTDSVLLYACDTTDEATADMPLSAFYGSKYLRAVYAAAARLQSTGRFEQSLDLCKSALKLAPYDEPINTYFIQALVSLGRSQLALSHYNKVVRTLREQFDVEPSEEFSELYREIMVFESMQIIIQVFLRQL